MNFDALTAGIEPGGLRSKNDIKLLICYMLASVQTALSEEEIVSILQENGLANYFEITDAFSDLVAAGNLAADEKKPGSYQVTDSGKLISEQLDISLPISVRERALSATLNLLAQVRRENENKVTIQKTENGYTVHCHVSGGEMELMSFSLYVPDMLQARMVKRIFHRDPQRVYQGMLALVTGNDDLLRELLQ